MPNISITTVLFVGAFAAFVISIIILAQLDSVAANWAVGMMAGAGAAACLGLLSR